MAEISIENVVIEHDGDVDQGLNYIRDHWNDRYVLEAFQDARTSSDRDGTIKIENIEGYYILRHLSDNRFSLIWRKN